MKAARKDREDLLSSLLSEPPQSDPEPLPAESLETSSTWKDLSESKTKDVGVQCGKLLHMKKLQVKLHSFNIQPNLTCSPVRYINIYPEPVIQHHISTQADMFLACSTPIISDTSTYTFQTLGDTDSNTSYSPSQEQAEKVLNEGEEQTADDIEACRKFLVYFSIVAVAILCLWS